MNFKRQTCFLFSISFFLFVSLNLSAQKTVSGKLVDNRQKPLSGATVRLMRTDSSFVSGTITNEQGRYTLNNVLPNEYLLLCSPIGMKSTCRHIVVKDTAVEVPVISFEEDAKMLKGVEVRAAAMVRKDDRLVITPTQQQVKHSYMGYDLLNNLMLPGLSVDRFKGTVKDLQRTVSLYIDGEKADYRMVVSLRARDVKQIEYIDVPSGKYSNDQVVINFITKEREFGGYVALDATETIGYTKGDDNVSSQLVKGKTYYTFWAGVSRNKNKRQQTVSEERIGFEPLPLNVQTVTNATLVRSHEEYLQAQIRNVGKRHTLGMRVGLVMNQTPHEESSGMLNYTGMLTQNTIQNTFVEKKGIAPKLMMRGEFKLTPQQTFSVHLQGTHSYSTYQRNYRENTFHSFTEAKNHFTNIFLQADYSLVCKDKSTLNVAVYDFFQNTIAKYSGDYLSTQKLISNETLVFLGYRRNINKQLMFLIRPGLSILRQRLNGTLDKNYLNIRLHSMLNWQIDKLQTLWIGFFIGNGSVNIASTSELEQKVNAYMVKRGNPSLGNIPMYLFEPRYNLQWGKWGLTVDLKNHLFKSFACTTYLIEGNKLVETYTANNNTGLVNQFSTAVTYKPCDDLKLELSYFYTRITENRHDFRLNTQRCNLKAIYQVKDFSFNADIATPTSEVDFEDAALGVKRRQPWKYSFTAAWSRKGWYAEVGVMNPFTKTALTRLSLNSPVYTFNQSITGRMAQQTAFVKLAYTFDFGRKKVEKDQSGVDKKIEQTILK